MNDQFTNIADLLKAMDKDMQKSKNNSSMPLLERALSPCQSGKTIIEEENQPSYRTNTTDRSEAISRKVRPPGKAISYSLEYARQAYLGTLTRYPTFDILVYHSGNNFEESEEPLFCVNVPKAERDFILRDLLKTLGKKDKTAVNKGYMEYYLQKTIRGE